MVSTASEKFLVLNRKETLCAEMHRSSPKRRRATVLLSSVMHTVQASSVRLAWTLPPVSLEKRDRSQTKGRAMPTAAHGQRLIHASSKTPTHTFSRCTPVIHSGQNQSVESQRGHRASIVHRRAYTRSSALEPASQLVSDPAVNLGARTTLVFRKIEQKFKEILWKSGKCTTSSPKINVG